MFASLPVPVDAFWRAVERRRAAGLSEPGSLFGSRPDPFTGAPGAFHAGVDVVVPTGTPLLAVDDGNVVAVERGTSAGDIVRYMTRHGRVSCMHLSRIDVDVGDVVRAGEVIGATGATGRVTGAHLHLELRPSSSSGAVDPLPFFPLGGEGGSGGGGAALALVLLAARVLL